MKDFSTSAQIQSVRSMDDTASETPAPVDVLRYARGFRDKWWVFLIVFLLGGGNIVYWMMQMRPVYRATAEVKILRSPETFTRFSPLVDETLRTSEDLNTVISVYQSTLFVDRVAARVKRENLDRFLAPLWDPKSGEKPPSVEQYLLENRSITPGRNNLIFTVTFSHPRPDVAAEVTNFFVEEFTAYESEMQADMAQRAVRDLRAQVETQRRRIENLEKDLVDFKERHGTISFDRKSDIDGQELLFLTNAYNEDKRKLDEAANKVAVLDTVLAEGHPAWEVPYIAGSLRVSQLLLTVAGKRMEISRLQARYRDKHPTMIEAKRSLAAAEKELNDAVDSDVQSVRNDYQGALGNFHDSEHKLEEKKQSTLQLQRLQASYDSMVRDLDSNQLIYQHLYQRVQETDAQSRNDGDSIRVIARATLPSRPFRPNAVYSAGVGVAGGGVFAFAVVLLLLVVDQKVKTQRDVEHDLRQPILATIEKLPGRDTVAARFASKALNTPSTCETMSSLAAGLRLSPQASGAKSFMVVSTLASEGKSFVAFAMGGSFLRLGEKVVVVSADLRVTGPEPSAGTNTLDQLSLTATAGWENFIGKDEYTGVDLVAAGARFDNPYALFNSPGFARLIEYLKQTYDRVIIDTPPLAHFGDALALSPFADIALLVIRFNRTPMRLVRRALESLRDARVPLLGTVVNAVRPREMKMYYPGYYRRPGALKRRERQARASVKPGAQAQAR